MFLERNTIWELEVQWFPHAAADGVAPWAVSYPSFNDKDRLPGQYSPHFFLFRNPPSRQDFLSLCDRLPWTNCWKDSLQAIIRENECDWPMIDGFNKRSVAEIKNDKGQLIGRLRVCRKDCFNNAAYATIRPTWRILWCFLCRYKQPERTELERFIDEHRNQIEENLTKLVFCPTEEDVKKEIRKVIIKWKKERQVSS